MTDHPRKIKLLHVTNVPSTLAFISGQVGYMKLQGLEVEVLSSPGKSLLEFAENQQIKAYAVEMPRRITPLQDILALIHLWKYFRQIRPDIVHAGTPKGGLLGTISAWLAGTPICIYQMRGLPMMTATGYKRSLLWWSEKISCLLADQVLCVSLSLRDVAISEGLCPAVKIKVLLGGSSNGVDAQERFNPAQIDVRTRIEICQQYKIPTDALVVGFVGRIVRDKGIIELTQAWTTLREEFPNLHLLIVGPFEPQDPIPLDVEHLLREDTRIHLTGRHQDTSPFYTAIDILTLPTYREGLPNTVLEAAAMQLPVVATSIPGCIDAVQDGITGILVPPHNAVALTDAIRVYLKNPELRKQHGQTGRINVLHNFKREAIWDALYQEYKQLLQAKKLPIPESISNQTEIFTH